MESDFPCLAEAIAEPRPDMIIKVTAFTEGKKFYYTNVTDLLSLLSLVSYESVDILTGTDTGFLVRGFIRIKVWGFALLM